MEGRWPVDFRILSYLQGYWGVNPNLQIPNPNKLSNPKSQWLAVGLEDFWILSYLQGYWGVNPNLQIPNPNKLSNPKSQWKAFGLEKGSVLNYSNSLPPAARSS